MANDPTPELLPCPHCGRSLIEVERRSRIGWFLTCRFCLAQGPNHSTKGSAIAAWNRRADASPLPPPGSAGEAEMVERMIERSYGSDWMKNPDLLRSMPHHRAQIRQVLDMLRAAFGGGGAAGEESG